MARVYVIAGVILLLLLATQTHSFSTGSGRSKVGLESMSKVDQSAPSDSISTRTLNNSPGSKPGASPHWLSQVAQSVQERDYIIPPADRSSLQTPTPMSDGDIVSYTAFNGTNYSLHQFNGKYTAVLIKPGDLDLFTIARVRDLLDRVDILYAHFKEFLPLEPAGSGLLRIAFVQTCGGGCGFIGAKGIEIDPPLLNPNSWGTEGVYGGAGPYVYIIHEMTHNFDRYSSYVMYGSDAGHAWTDFMNFYIGVYDRFSTGNVNPEALLQSRIDSYFAPYLQFPGSTWETCIRDNLCAPGASMQQHAQGGIVLRIAQLHGPRAAKQAMTYIQNAIATRGLNPPAMTILEKNDLLVESLSYGAETNMACYLDTWRWPISSALRAQLTAAFGVNPKCEDSDHDGYSPVQGDCDDANSAMHPGAVEVLNDIDDDCDGIVDDLLFAESGDFPNSWPSASSLPVPARVRGVISSASDSDNFKINLSTTTLTTFTLKSLGSFRGWFFLLNQGTGDWRTFFYVDAGASGSLNITLEPGQWNFYVAFNAASTVGGYELIARQGQPWPLPFSVPTAIGDQLNHYILVAPVIPSYLSGSSNVMARFWVSGIGWVGSVPASPAMQMPFNWTAPAGIDVRALTYRVQFLAANIPLTDVSSPAGFMASPSIGSSHNADFDGDGRAELGFYRAGLWGFLKSSLSYSFGGAQFFSWGGAGLQPICADFDGDDKADAAHMVAPSGGQSAAYAILKSSTGYDFGQALFVSAGFPSLGDIPVVADFDGDGKADPGIWRASQGAWIIPLSSSNYTSFVFTQWGQLGDTPVAVDFDGDARADIGFYRNGLWGVLKSTQAYSFGSAQFFSWGGPGLQPVVGDFDGDSTADIGYITLPSGGQSAAYAILKSGTGYDFGQALFVAAGFPSIGDTPVVGDFDGDGRADPGIWRESQGVWIIALSSGNYSSFLFTQWGQAGDIAFPNSTGRR